MSEQKNYLHTRLQESISSASEMLGMIEADPFPHLQAMALARQFETTAMMLRRIAADAVTNGSGTKSAQKYLQDIIENSKKTR